MNERGLDRSGTRVAEQPRDAWRRRVLALAREAQSEFTALLPAETGLTMTIYASERDDCLAVIVDRQQGVHYAPSPGSKAFAIGDRIGDSAVDRWARANVDALRGYATGTFDTIEFYKRMQPVRSA